MVGIHQRRKGGRSQTLIGGASAALLKAGIANRRPGGVGEIMASLNGSAAAGPAPGFGVSPAEARTGLLAGFLANTCWGFLPLLFHLLDAVDPVLIVAERTVWSLVVVVVLLAFWRQLGPNLGVLRDRKRVVRLLVSAALLACNWLIYVWAVANDHVLEASFGYFITPLVNVAVGMVMLGERQNRWQGIAIGIAIIAIAIQAVGLGSIPYVALGLAGSVGLYGYVRKTVQVSSSGGLLVETLLIVPVALAYIAFTFVRDGAGPHADPCLLFLLVCCGPATAVPLLLFAYAVRRLRLTTIGMLQYVAPSIQFALSITVFGEHLNAVRLFSFVIIWVSLAVFTIDGYRRRAPRAVPA
jgi:chloramphenicol-sensitive protein RarD